MNEEKKIELLLEAFYKGETTVEEEKLLMQFLSSENLNEKWHTDRDLFKALYDTSSISLPEGLSARLEKSIDNQILKTTSLKSISKIRKLYISIASVAAVILLCIGMFFLTDKLSKSEHLVDTFTDPAEAAIVTEQILVFVSSTLNQGLSSLDKINESINKTNEILNENLKLN